MTAPDTDTLAGLLAECTPGPWEAFIDDTGGQWSGWPLSISAPSITDKTVVRPGGQWPYEWDAKTSQHEAVTNAHLIALAPELAAETIALRAQAAKDKARIERLQAALQPFSIMAGEMFARNWNKDGVAISFVGKDGPIRLTFTDFLAARAALEDGE